MNGLSFVRIAVLGGIACCEWMAGDVLCAEEPLRVGVATADITPPMGYRKAGGYNEVLSTGVHDPLLAKAIVFAQGEVRFGLVVCDLCGVPEFLTTPARAEAAAAAGIPVEHLVMAATHTHGSPEFYGPLRDIWHARAVAAHGRDPHETIDYPEFLMRQCVDAVTRAAASLRESQIRLCIARQEGLAFNRRFHMRDGTVRFNPGKLNPDILRVAGPVDEELPFLTFTATGEEQPFAGLTVFAMHTASFTGSEFGADFPMHLESGLREAYGPEIVSLFGEGTAGDVNHIDVRSSAAQRGNTEPERIGRVLAETIRLHSGASRRLESVSLAARSDVVRSPITAVEESQFQSAMQLLADQERNGATFLQLVAAWRDCHRWLERQRHGPEKPELVQAVRLNADTAIITLPHELFVELGMTIKASSPFRHTLVLSLANDSDYYIPTRRAFEEGSYEVTTCPLDPGCGERLVQAAVRLLHELKP